MMDDEGLNDVDNDSDEEFDLKTFHGDGEGFEDIGCDYYDDSDDEYLIPKSFMEMARDSMILVVITMTTAMKNSIA